MATMGVYYTSKMRECIKTEASGRIYIIAPEYCKRDLYGDADNKVRANAESRRK
jgi:hypothetical protein